MKLPQLPVRFPERLQPRFQPFARSLVMVRSWPVVIDLGLAACLLAAFFALVHTGHYVFGTPVPVVPISHSLSALPLYSFYSVIRIGIAYLLSLAFAISYGYTAAYNPRVEAWMVATLDILQSIPVLSFLPPVVLAMVALVPGHQLGIELGVVLLIFTGQVWNLAFSFYSSLKSIPKEMLEASRIYRYSAWQRFWQLEMPYAAIGLVWNSIVSVAGGWFALIACEMFTMGDRNFQLPGLGSYLRTASDSGDVTALIAGITTVILIVVATDQLIWRPLIAWSDKFKFEQVESADRVTSPILELIQRSHLLSTLPSRLWSGIEEPIYRRLSRSRDCRVVQPIDEDAARKKASPVFWLISALILAVILWGASKAVVLLSQLTGSQIVTLLEGAIASFLRVNVSLIISALWTIPVGVAIGFNPKLARIIQPVAQIFASVPATAFFPVLLLGLVKIGGGLGIGSIALMLLGTQWYILFNVIAGAMSIPSDLREAASLYKFTRYQRWTTLILPGIFPYLITGMVTASGGAWNASVFAEYFKIGNQTLQTLGLGQQIDIATDAGQFPILLAATILISLMVVSMNRLVWRRLYRLAETKYKLLA
ncbi:ABC transporter permease [Acidicapsa dinghuensis]|uniref:ABC transporter permease n=1 Tax=Acidicapsa dinghuensis TaxID=2218256 RepID=A0ABW1EQ21_9BACT|nr:ABC transporter permease subunit [Acidicapsa dinghuensis]